MTLVPLRQVANLLFFKIRTFFRYWFRENEVDLILCAQLSTSKEKKIICSFELTTVITISFPRLLEGLIFPQSWEENVWYWVVHLSAPTFIPQYISSSTPINWPSTPCCPLHGSSADSTWHWSFLPWHWLLSSLQFQRGQGYRWQ